MRKTKYRLSVYLEVVGLLLLVVGCSEPDTIGRFRATPVTTIILDNLGVIDEDPDIFAGARETEPQDLVPEEIEYVIRPGDSVLVTIMDLFEVGQQYREILRVNEVGRVTLPEIGTFRTSGLTEMELTETIKDRLSPQIIVKPIVSVVVTDPRKKTYSISGAVSWPGTYQLWEGDYRLTKALDQAGGIPQTNVDYAYVVRDVRPNDADQVMASAGAKAGDSDLSALVWAGAGKTRTENSGPRFEQKQPVEQRDPVALVEELEQQKSAEEQEKTMKVIRRGDKFLLAPVEGKVVPEAAPQRAVLQRPGETEEGTTFESLEKMGLVQEVIQIDLQKLRGGNWKQNIVIRPEDEIRVPVNAVGIYNVMGQVARPGAYNLSGDRMTLKQVIGSAGPLMPTAWPSRCEIIRRVDKNKEVTCRVNLAKLFAGTSPDYFVKPNDIINVGSHPVARWIAVVRQSFRSTYGFGFVYDRNFADKDFRR
ncbi:polysaccharide biosynthesis/export family protein [Planctomycetota bacterium]